MHHECPSCRAKLASRRSSKPDVKFDLLVQLFSGEKRKFDGMDGDGDDQAEGAQNGSSSEAKSSPRPFGNGSTSTRNQEVEEAVDLQKYRDMHKKNVGKFRELRAQKILNAAKGNNGAGSRRSAANNAQSTYEPVSGSKKGGTGASKDTVTTTGAGDNKVWLKLYPVPEVCNTFANVLQMVHDFPD